MIHSGFTTAGRIKEDDIRCEDVDDDRGDGWDEIRTVSRKFPGKKLPFNKVQPKKDGEIRIRPAGAKGKKL